MTEAENPTDPAAPLTDRQMLESIQECLSSLAADFRLMTATIGVVIGDAQSFNRRMSELETRVMHLEQRNGSGYPAEDGT